MASDLWIFRFAEFRNASLAVVCEPISARNCIREGALYELGQQEITETQMALVGVFGVLIMCTWDLTAPVALTVRGSLPLLLNLRRFGTNFGTICSQVCNQEP